MTYTVDDVRYLIPEALTGGQARGIEAYLNEGVVPPADPCLSCEPNLVRRYINRIQKAEADGTWPPVGRIDGELNAPEPEAVAEPEPPVETPRPARTRKPKAE